MTLKLIKEEITTQSLKDKIELLSTLYLQEGYTRETLAIDAKVLGVCTECIQDLAITKGMCTWCRADLLGEL